MPTNASNAVLISLEIFTREIFSLVNKNRNYFIKNGSRLGGLKRLCHRDLLPFFVGDQICRIISCFSGFLL